MSAASCNLYLNVGLEWKEEKRKKNFSAHIRLPKITHTFELVLGRNFVLADIKYHVECVLNERAV